MKNIILRPWKTEDTKVLATAANHPQIAQNLRNVFPYPYTVEDAAWFINDCIQKEGTDQLLRAIEVDGTIVGSEKAGFVWEGTMRDGIYKNGRVRSYCMYALLRREAQLLYGE